MLIPSKKRHFEDSEKDRTNDKIWQKNHLFSDLFDHAHDGYKQKKERDTINSLTGFLSKETVNNYKVEGNTAFEKKNSLYRG